MRRDKTAKWIEKNFGIEEFKIDDDGNSENVGLTSEVKSSLVVCENVIRSALMRQESRGAHYRSGLIFQR